MLNEFFFELFLLNLRGTVFFTALRSVKGVIGISGCMTLSLALSVFSFPEYVNRSILDRPIFSIFVEILLGLTLGLSLSFLFEFIPFLGRLIDTFRGVQFQEQVAPELGARDSRLEIFAGFVVVAYFFQPKFFLSFIELYLRITEKVGVGGFDGFDYIDTQLYFSDKRGALVECLSTLFHSSLAVIIPLIAFSIIIELGFSIVLKFNSKLHLGTDLTLIRAFAGLAIVPLLVSSSDTLPAAILHLLEIGKGFLLNFS